jgi:hypothetical protein
MGYLALLIDGMNFVSRKGAKALRSDIIRQLTKRVGELPQDVLSVVKGLQLPMLEELGEALLDFTSVADLHIWLQARIS